ncbi:hypothetical protein KOAAANKH_03528 [Brevundimonas sp. NIBR10]|uniref:hypothetical protein n=1 Tax=Brevundimonas sp. NIBR10 TaxID=3015997 RepID=UPI0022F1CE92|nr:hypothetical protein [Brevundimonas sp. NIBR10]WGM48625.1 hypothetical protein KOAAANKH_03528 [Brevundimonas sp. NIBR10]
MLIMISMLAAMQTAPTPAQANDLDTRVRAVRSCMDAASLRLEPSGEAAPVIADAAMMACDNEREEVEVLVRSLAATPEGGETMAREVMTTLDGEMRRRALLQVVELRASRRVP